MKIINISNKGRLIYLFCRNENGEQYIDTVNDFYPYYYEPFVEGSLRSNTGESLKKIIVSEPKNIQERRSSNAWEADIHFTKRYLIDKVKEIEKAPIKWAMMDIEVLSDSMPDVNIADKPVSSITIYNSFSKEYKTFYLGDYEGEYNLMQDFIAYLHQEKFDLLCAWNISFDFNYLHNRFENFAQNISPINQVRYGGENIVYPAGTSIVDYYSWFKKITMNREKSYKLDDIAQKYLGDNAKEEVDFANLSEMLRNKNKLDVNQLVRLEEQKQLFPFFDEIRRLTKVEWEDLLWTSRMIDQLLLQEAKNQNIVLPMKPSEERGTLTEKEEFEGAFREIFRKGRFESVGKYDLSSCYPFMIKAFCLDSSNIRNEDQPDCLKINDTYFYQDKNAILPLVVDKLITLKTQLKEKLSTINPSSNEYEDLKMKLDAVKTIVNSSYGVMGNRFFRLYNLHVASATTYLVRSLMKYIIEKLKEQNLEVIYADTDSVLIDNNSEDISNLLNSLIKKWAYDNYDKESINLEFNYEGKFKNLLLLALCRYVGNLETKKGIKKEMCGVEAKRKDSTVFMQIFQEELIDKILAGEEKNSIIEWIKNKIDTIKEVPIESLGFPCKLAKTPEEYKNVPIFIRALKNTKNFEVNVGENFYYIYVIPKEYEQIENVVDFLDGEKLTNTLLKKEWEKYFDEKILVKDMNKDVERKEKLLGHLETSGRLTAKKIKEQGKAIDVIAFNNKKKDHVKDVDWERLVDRNIMMKIDVIFEALNWNLNEIKDNYISENTLKSVKNKTFIDKECSQTNEHSKKVNICDLDICKQNKEGACQSEDPQLCPKNNEQSIYENKKLLK